MAAGFFHEQRPLTVPRAANRGNPLPPLGADTYHDHAEQFAMRAVPRIEATQAEAEERDTHMPGAPYRTKEEVLDQQQPNPGSDGSSSFLPDLEGRQTPKLNPSSQPSLENPRPIPPSPRARRPLPSSRPPRVAKQL